MAQNKRMATTMNPLDPGVANGGALGALGVLAIPGRYVLIGTAGNIVGQMLEDTGDVTYVFPVGMWPAAFKSVTSATAAGFIIL
jgi:hypothetical protein